MCGADDQWVKAAMADDTVVVELLLRLHGAPPKHRILKQLEWTVRQRRSSGHNKQRKQAQAQRASPATPLSWSGVATSLSGGSGGSGGGGGDEESSRPPTQNVSASARSKVSGEGEKTASKRSRKKKTLTELRDEERSLLKERKDLKRDIAALRLNLEKQRTTNENFKRMKIESQPLQDRDPPVAEESVPVSDQLHQKTMVCHPMLPTISGNGAITQPSTSTVHPVQKPPEDTSKLKFVLPDLNLPFDDCPEAMGRERQTGTHS